MLAQIFPWMLLFPCLSFELFNMAGSLQQPLLSSVISMMLPMSQWRAVQIFIKTSVLTFYSKMTLNTTYWLPCSVVTSDALPWRLSHSLGSSVSPASHRIWTGTLFPSVHGPRLRDLLCYTYFALENVDLFPPSPRRRLSHSQITMRQSAFWQTFISSLVCKTWFLSFYLPHLPLMLPCSFWGLTCWTALPSCVAS